MTTERPDFDLGSASDVVTELFGLTDEELALLSPDALRDCLAVLSNELTPIYREIHSTEEAIRALTIKLEQLKASKATYESRLDQVAQHSMGRAPF